MENYKVAIIIPCWNSSMFLRQMLDSVICQTFTDYQVFCVDDESEDDTMLILQEYANKDQRFKIVSRNRLPKGAPTCRNIGFDLSVGAEYVIWFDSDDLIAPYCLEQRVQFMDNHPELDFGCFKAKTFKTNPSEIEDTYLYGFKYPFADDLTRMLRKNNPFGGWEMILRRSSISKSKIVWDEKLLSGQDTEFILQLFMKGLKYEYAKNSKIDYYYRIGFRPYSITLNKFTDANKVSNLYLLNKIYNNLTNAQKKRYACEMDNYILDYVTLFYQDRAFVGQLLQLDWTKDRNWFRYRTIICCHLLIYMNRKIRHLLFPLTFIHRRSFFIRFRRYHRNQLLQEVKRGFAFCA